jgi:phage internal scaffolding protein
MKAYQPKNFAGVRSVTQQHHRDKVNINSIMARARKTGVLPGRGGTPLFGDFTNVPSYQDQLNRLIQVRDDFDRLPSEIRDRFKNDPGKLYDWLDNPQNLKEACEIGLLPMSLHPDNRAPEENQPPYADLATATAVTVEPEKQQAQ